MNVREELLKQLAQAEGGFVSGAALAERLGVSRNAVWKAVKALTADGYDIASSAAGYRLSESTNKLSAEMIAPHLRTESLGRVLTVLDAVDSTNNAAKKLASAGAAHGTTVTAERQTGGKGRLGRTFVSPAGTGVYMSVIVRPDFGLDVASMITSAAAVAAARAVEKLSGADVQIKWVNDLYMNGRKICGILTEASLGMEMSSLDYAVIGIGVNVRSVRSDFDSELQSVATSIEDETGLKLDRSALCAEILNELEVCLGQVADRSFLPEYRRRELLTGHEITASVGGQTMSGLATGVDDNANLIVQLPDGTERHLSSGEASLCRVKK
ncbi:MAG: biotin--[Ruminococcus sp.]|nr:biotin--[acetyl-CoA-carboxylase] ligase [Ruminococcus sp.]